MPNEYNNNNKPSQNTLIRYPQVLDSEEKLLACLLIDNQLVIKSKDILRQSDFGSILYGTIYKAMVELYDTYNFFDIDSLIEYIKIKDLIKEPNWKNQVIDLLNASFGTPFIDTYIQQVKEASIKRHVMDTCNLIMNKGADPDFNANDYIDFAEQQMFAVSNSRISSEFTTLSKVASDYYDKIVESRKAKDRLTGLDTGYEAINNISNGLQKEELIVIGARPAMGKSAFAIQLALNVVQRGKKVAFFSLEMSNEQIVSRIVSNISHVDNGKLRNVRINENDLSQINYAVNKCRELGLYFDDTTTSSVGAIRSKCRKLKQSEGLDLIVIDYLQLLKLSDQHTNKNRETEVSEISRMLKQMAKELKVPVIALSQLSRRVEERAREDRRPKLNDLRESGAIEQDADMVLFLYRNDYYEKDPEKHTNIVEVIVEKYRQGTSGYTIEFVFQGEYTKFTKYSKERVDEN